MPDNSEFVREAIDELLGRQLRDDAPPEVRQTLMRLIASGYTAAEAQTLIGCALSREMFEVLGSDGVFNEARYVAGLERLPALPWEGEP